MAEKIIAAHQVGLKVTVFDDEGHMLWYSPEWVDAGEGKMDNPSEGLGLKWQEFIHARDISAVREFLRGPDGASVRFLAQGTKPNLWLVCAMVKRRIGRYWLAVGDNRIARPDEVPSDDMPSMGCAYAV
jgi:hypothetical protein